MSAVSTSVLLTLVLFIHSSDAITCYVCRSKGVPACDDPFRNSTSIHTLKCPSNACLKLQGTTKLDGAWFTGVVRGCGTSEMNECSALENEPVAELHLTDATGTLCYCTDELCNAAAQTSVAGTAVKFGVASLLAMTAVRVHSG